MPRQKPPVIEDYLPKPEDVFDLDDDKWLHEANLRFNSHLKIADEYDHYPHCKWALIEFKSRNIRDSIEQLDWTAKQLVEMRRDVDYVIIIAEAINNPEKNLYRKQDNLLIYKPTRKPVAISTSNGLVNVQIFDPYEIDKQYTNYRGTLRPWQSK